jgi:DnaJ-class molecular chaperone
MKTFLRPLFWIPMILLVWASCSFYMGDRYRNAAWLKKQNDQLQAATNQLTAEQARGDALTTALLTSQSQIDQLSEEAHRGIKNETTGRACLGSGALRVLNSAPGLRTQLAPTSSTAAAHGSIAAPADDASSEASNGDEFATDTQIADWAIDAGTQFETCRTRLDKLIDWHGAP